MSMDRRISCILLMATLWGWFEYRRQSTRVTNWWRKKLGTACWLPAQMRGMTLCSSRLSRSSFSFLKNWYICSRLLELQSAFVDEMQNDMQLLSVTPSVVWTGTAFVCRRNRKISGIDLISSWTFGVRTAPLHNHVSVYSMQGDMTSIPPVVKEERRITKKVLLVIFFLLPSGE